MTAPMQCGSLEAMMTPSRDTTLTSSMSSSFAHAAMLSIGRACAEPMWRTAVRATCPSIVSIAPATVSWRLRTEKSSCALVLSSACPVLTTHATDKRVA